MTKSSQEHTNKNNKRRAITTWIFLGIIILFVVFVRVRLLDVPLERDEGEYAYMGQLLLQGIPPYSEAYNMKFPGTYLMYAVILALLGQTTQGIHTGFMIMNCSTIILIFYLSRRIIKDTGAITASAAYAVLSLSSSVLGFAAHATHFVVLPAVAGTLLLLNATDKNKPYLYCLSGIMFGLAGMMKQPGFFFLMFGALYILYNYVSSRPAGLSEKASFMSAHSLKNLFFRLGIFTIGAALPVLVIFVWLYLAGVFDKFWFWTVEYASKYGSRIPLSQAFFFFREGLSSAADGFFPVWLLSAFGFAALFFHRELRAARVFILLFLLFSFLSICPGFYFREHYFVTLLPAISILTGIFVDYAELRTASFFKSPYLRFTGLVVFIVAILPGIVSQRGYLFQDGPVRVARNFYGPNPFPESVEIAKFIESSSRQSDRIAVLGSEPQIFFYSKRHSATGYIYVYGLMEVHEFSMRMQREMINEIESSRPKFIVLVQVSTSWLVRPESEKYIFSWVDNYLSRNYTLVGIADTISPETTVYKWYADAERYNIRSPYYTLVFKRR